MASAKDVLRQVVERLTEEQARQVLDDIEELVKPKTAVTRDDIAILLEGEPAIRPPADATPFEAFEPFAAPGTPASQLLINDRR